VYQGYFKQKPYHIHPHGIRAISVEFLGNNVVHEGNLLENWNGGITTWNVPSGAKPLRSPMFNRLQKYSS
jgi:hypothetical protein